MPNDPTEEGKPTPAFVPPEGFSLLSVVMPCYRLAGSVGKNLRAVAGLLAPIPFEIVPVDDGSGDGTAEAISSAAAEIGPERCRPVLLRENGGKGAALVAGFRASRGSHVLLLDGDLDLDPARIWRFFEIMREKRADVVIGSKMHPESTIDYPWSRRLASFVYYSIVRALVRLPVHDTQTGMKLFTREALGHAFDRMLTKRFAFDLEVLSILRDAGYRIAEAPITLDFGDKVGALTLRNVRDVMWDTLAIFYRTRLLGYYKTLEPRPMPADPPSVTAVVACPGTSAVLRECVDALAAQRAAYPKLDAILLPDAPTGETWPDWVHEIPTGKVLPSDKRNLGIREARGEIVAFVDDDARPLPGWLEHAIPYFGDPAVGAVGGPAVTPPEDPFAAKMSGRVYANPLVSAGARRRYVPTRVTDEDDLPSCNLLVRASLLREIGGYDTAHWPGEDTILCLEIARRARLVYDPWTVVAHHRRPLFGPHLRQVSRYARHRGYFAKKFPETSRRFAYFVPSLLLVGTIGTLVCWLLCVATGLLCLHFRSDLFGGFAWIFGLLAGIGIPVLLFYLVVVLAFSFSTRLRVWAWTAAGIVATHYAYGWNFLRGLFARSMPDGVKPFDHAGTDATAGTAAVPPRKRVLFLASQPYFQWRGSPIRLGFDVRAIAENGFDVDFLTLPIGEDRPVEGVRILRCPNLFFAKKIAIGPSPLKLAFDAVMFVEALGMVCRRHYDVVHGVEDCGLPAWILSRLARAKAVFEKHSDAGSYKKGFVIRAYRAVERFVMRHADAVIGTGPALVRQVEETGAGTPAFCVSDIPSSLVEPDTAGTAAARGELEKSPGEILATYVGSFAVYQGIDLLFASIPVAVRTEPRLRFVIVGGTPEEIAERTEQMHKAGCAERVSFVGKIPPDRLPCYLAASDLLLSPRIQGLNTPLKLLDYLKVARGIVATDHPANRLILDETTALFAAPEPEPFGAAVAELARDAEKRAALAAHCRALVDERYNFGVFKRGLREVYANVLRQPSAAASR